MSWVFLTEQYAYKLKKPIVTSLLDFRTGAARRAACEEELRLNRRLAPNVYLAVVPLVQTRSGWRVEDEGDAVDWLVKMRRLPRASMLDARIAAGSIPSTELDRLADVLSAFYARAERAPATSADYCERLSADIRSKRGSLALPRYALPRDEIEALVAALSGWMSRHQVSLEQRATSIVEAHGDLRPEHISLESEPTVIDCLEFDRSLRLLDPLSELSPGDALFAWQSIRHYRYRNDVDGARRAFAQVQRADAHSYAAHAALLMALTEKWGGSHADMFQHARQVSSALPAGHPLHALIAMAHLERWVYAKYFDSDQRIAVLYVDNDEVKAEVLRAHDRWLNGAPRSGGAALMARAQFACWFHVVEDRQRLAIELRALDRVHTPAPWHYLGDSEEVLKEVYSSVGL